MKQKGNKNSHEGNIRSKGLKGEGGVGWGGTKKTNKNTSHKRDDKEGWMQQLLSGVLPADSGRSSAASLQRYGTGGGAAVHNISYNSMYNMAAAVQRRSDT